MTQFERVLAAMQEAAETAILPRFRALKAGDIEEKSPGEVVTSADREAEVLLTQALQAIRPDALVVGEEAATADPALLDSAVSASSVWFLDPLDGTSNFIAGKADFAVMVALVEGGETVQAWVWQPVPGVAWVAERGAGAIRNGVRVKLDGARTPGTMMQGSVRTRFLDDEHRVAVETNAPDLGAELLPGSGCAGVDYPEVAVGVQDFVMFRRTLPWDHSPGALILREAGGVVRRWDGSEYMPCDGKEGLLAARDIETWERVARSLLQLRHRVPRGER